MGSSDRVTEQPGTMTTTLEDVTTTAEHLVVKAQQMFDRLLGEAMPRTESLSLIRSAEGQWKSQT